MYIWTKREEDEENANVVEMIIEIKVEENFLQEWMLLNKLKLTIMMFQRKRAPVNTVRTGMNMRKELMK